MINVTTKKIYYKKYLRIKAIQTKQTDYEEAYEDLRKGLKIKRLADKKKEPIKMK